MHTKPSYCGKQPTEHQKLGFRLDPKSLKDFVGRYPRVLGKIAIAAQLPSVQHAAIILRDAKERRRSYSEWVLMHYGGDAMRAVRSTLGHKNTENHHQLGDVKS
jgi:hypothetical protein